MKRASHLHLLLIWSSGEEECVCVRERECGWHVCICLMSLVAESGTLQVRTSNSWMRGEDEKKKKTLKGIRRPNLSSSALLRHTQPPAVWQEQNTLRSTLRHLCSGVHAIGLSLLLQPLLLLEWIIVRVLRRGFSAVLEQPASVWGWFTRDGPLWTQPSGN